MRVRFTVQLTAVWRHDEREEIYVAGCPAIRVWSQGETKEEAFKALRSAVFMYVRHCYSRNILDNVLNNRGFEPCDASEVDDCTEFVDVQEINDKKYPHSFSIDVPLNLLAAQHKVRPRKMDGARVAS